MIIDVFDNIVGTTQYNLCVKSINSVKYTQRISYISTVSGVTRGYDRGPTYDKWEAEFTLQDFEVDIFTLMENLNINTRQITLTPNSSELIFGPGIDYANPITCNVLNLETQTPQIDNAHAELTLRVEALHSNNAQLAFDSSVPGSLPSTLNYQAPLNRQLNRFDSPFSSAAFGEWGQNNPITASGDPIRNNTINIVLRHNEAESARIAKTISLQRATAFVWPDSSAPNLFPNQDTVPVIIKGFTQSRVKENLWDNRISIVSNAA